MSADRKDWKSLTPRRSSIGGGVRPDQLERVVGHFDRLSESREWSRLYEVADGESYHYHLRRSRVMELLPDRLGRVADLGCGPGVMVPPVLDRRGTFFGVDVAPAMIKEANERFRDVEGVSFQVGDIEQLDLPDGSFDQIICMGVIEYLVSPDRALAEMARLLSRGGVAVVSVSKRWHIDRLTVAATAPARALARRLGAAGSGQVSRTGMQPEDLDALAASVGLHADGGAHYNFTPLPYPLTRIAPELTMRLNRPFERWHGTDNRMCASLARGYVGRYLKAPIGG